MSISFHPSVIAFPRPLTQNVKSALTITNNDNQPVAFKVKTTAPKLYCVRPNTGRVEAGQSIQVQVLRPATKEEPQSMGKDKFLIQSTVIPPGKETLSLAEIWNTNDGEIHSKKIRVAFLQPEGVNIPGGEESALTPLVEPSVFIPLEASSNQYRPQLFQDQSLAKKLAEAEAEIIKLRALLAKMPNQEAKGPETLRSSHSLPATFPHLSDEQVVL